MSKSAWLEGYLEFGQLSWRDGHLRVETFPDHLKKSVHTKWRAELLAREEENRERRKTEEAECDAAIRIQQIVRGGQARKDAAWRRARLCVNIVSLHPC